MNLKPLSNLTALPPDVATTTTTTGYYEITTVGRDVIRHLSEITVPDDVQALRYHPDYCDQYEQIERTIARLLNASS